MKRAWVKLKTETETKRKMLSKLKQIPCGPAMLSWWKLYRDPPKTLRGGSPGGLRGSPGVSGGSPGGLRTISAGTTLLVHTVHNTNRYLF